MARRIHYDLYEGDGEVIREEEAPQPPESRPQDRRRYFVHEEMPDEEEAPSTLFDDFDRYQMPLPRRTRTKHPEREPRRGLWAFLLVLGLICLSALTLLALPQLTGVRYRFLPQLAFVNGNIIQMDSQKLEQLHQAREEIYSDRIYSGVYIDSVHLGGMTREEAVQRLTRDGETTGEPFDIIVSIGNQEWHVNTERVPVSRNVEEMVQLAWAAGRSQSSGLRGSGVTPFQDRVNQVADLRSYPLILETRQDYDHTALRTLVEGIVNYVNRDPVNSTVESFDFNTKAFSFSEDRPGAFIDRDELYGQLTRLLDGGTTRTTLRVTPEKILAEITRTELMNRFGLISSYTTQTTSNKNRNTNIQLSAQAINGKTVMPGETFSFNQATGERTAAKGYREAAAIAGGQSRDEIGGGVCQTSSTLFNAVARADLEIVERNPHAWPSNYVEKGFDATVNWPGLDFKFRNNTDWPIFIIAGYAKQKITVNLYGMSLGADSRIELESITTKTIPQPEGTEYVINPELAPGESKKTVTGRKGYVVETWKVWLQGDREVRRELLFKTTYKAYQEKVEYNPR